MKHLPHEASTEQYQTYLMPHSAALHQILHWSPLCLGW